MASAYPSLRWWILPFLRSRIWTVRGIENLPSDGGFIIVANHQSWLDSAILAAAIYRRLRKPLKFVSQSKKWGAIGGMPIDDNDRSKVLDRAFDFLQQGYPVAIFPEGNSNKMPELRTGKTGAARLALRTGLPVIPAGIKGTRGVAAWRAVMWFFSLVQPCHVEIGQSFTFQKTEIRDEESELLHTTTDTILQHISELSGKPMPGEGPALGQRGILWFFLWRLARPFAQWRVRIKGAENLPRSGPFIVAANHGSYFDAPALALAVFHATGLQAMFPTKASVAEIFEHYAGRGGLNALGMLPLDKSDKSKVLGPAIQHLRHGGVIGIYPEGMRNKPKVNPNWRTEMLKGKTGAARLVIATGVTIVPVGIKAPKGLGVAEAILKAFLPWNFIRVTFGPPVKLTTVPADLETATKDDLDRLTAEIMRSIAALTGLKYSHYHG